VRVCEVVGVSRLGRSVGLTSVATEVTANPVFRALLSDSDAIRDAVSGRICVALPGRQIQPSLPNTGGG
jgi:hypothetical protein